MTALSQSEMQVVAHRSCPSCETGTPVHTATESFCASCGVVLDTAPMVSVGPRMFEHSAVPSVPKPVVLNHQAFKTTLYAQLDNRNRTERDDRRMLKVAGERLEVPESVIYRAGRIKSDILSAKVGYRLNHQLLIGVSFLIACREFKVPRTLNRVGDSVDVRVSTLVRHYRIIGRALGLTVGQLSPEIYLRGYLEKSGWSVQKRAEAMRVLRDYLQVVGGIPGSSATVAAGVLAYVARQDNPPVGWTPLRRLTGFTEITLRAVVREMRLNFAEAAGRPAS